MTTCSVDHERGEGALSFATFGQRIGVSAAGHTEPCRAREQAAESRKVATQVGAQLALGRGGNDGFQCLDEGLVRHLRAIARGTEDHPPATPVDLGRELRGEPRLADSRFAGHEREHSLTRRSPVPALEQPFTLLLATHAF